MIVYILLCGFPPFYGDNDAQMFKRIKAGQYKFLSPYWDPISADAKDFVRNLLIVRCVPGLSSRLGWTMHAPRGKILRVIRSTQKSV